MNAIPLIRFGTSPPPAEPGTPANILAGNPRTSAQNYYSDASGRFHAGIWESTRGKWAVHYTEDEFCVLLAGRCVLTDNSGVAQAFKAGDAFVVPAGFTGTWETVEDVRKYYVIHEPAG